MKEGDGKKEEKKQFKPEHSAQENIEREREI
jgi:hypothetical protein